MRAIVLAAMALTTLGCDKAPGSLAKDTEISIVRLGQQNIEDRNSYDYTSSVSFRATQKYKIKSLKKSAEPRLLYMKVTQFAGGVVEQETSPTIVPLDDGEFEFECSTYVSIKTSEEKSWGPIRCEFEPLAIFEADGQASLSKAPAGSASTSE